MIKYKRAWAALAPVAMLWMVIGCGPASLAMFLLPWNDDKDEPKVKLADANKEITVVVATHFQNLEVRPELMSADQQLSEALATELGKLFKENKEKVKVVPPTRVRASLMKLREWDAASLREVAEKYSADYLIAIDIRSMSLVLPRSFDTLYQGQVDLHVKLLDSHEPLLECVKFEDGYYQSGFPQNRPIDRTNSSVDMFRRMFVNKIAGDLATWFAAHPSNTKFDMAPLPTGN
jgi:hypothetical protein